MSEAQKRIRATRKKNVILTFYSVVFFSFFHTQVDKIRILREKDRKLRLKSEF